MLYTHDGIKNIFMEVSEHSETVDLIQYNHNDKVIGLAIYDSILFTCTEYYVYAWLDKQNRLLAMFHLPSNLGEVFIPMRQLAIDSKTEEEWEILQALLGSSDKIVRIFTAKAYYEIFRMKIRKHKERQFIPHCHTPYGPFAVENNYLSYYPECSLERVPIIALPSEDTCTKIKCMQNTIYLGMESGRIFAVDAQRKDSSGSILTLEDAVTYGVNSFNVSLRGVYEKRQLPILDFIIDPVVVSYFGKQLHADKLVYPEKEQVLSIYSMHPLFIVLTPSHFLLLNESLHVLYKDRVRGDGVEYLDRVFISQDSGILSEIIIIPSY